MVIFESLMKVDGLDHLLFSLQVVFLDFISANLHGDVVFPMARLAFFWIRSTLLDSLTVHAEAHTVLPKSSTLCTVDLKISSLIWRSMHFMMLGVSATGR